MRIAQNKPASELQHNPASELQLKQLDFRSFLLHEFNMSYNSYLSLLDSYKLQLRLDYDQWLLDGCIISDIGSYLRRQAHFNNNNSSFVKWLKRRSLLSYNEYLNLSRSDKLRIYNQYSLEVGFSVEE